MTDTADLGPLEFSQPVAATVSHSFETFVTRIAAWWPRDHMAHPDGGEVVFEREVGGRIFERGPTGEEIDWGIVTAYDPPAHVAFSWHIGASVTDATDVEIRFVADSDDTTTVHLVHAGWQRLGATGAERRNGNRAGWSSVLPAFVAAVH